MVLVGTLRRVSQPGETSQRRLPREDVLRPVLHIRRDLLHPMRALHEGVQVFGEKGQANAFESLHVVPRSASAAAIAEEGCAIHIGAATPLCAGDAHAATNGDDEGKPRELLKRAQELLARERPHTRNRRGRHSVDRHLKVEAPSAAALRTARRAVELPHPHVCRIGPGAEEVAVTRSNAGFRDEACFLVHSKCNEEDERSPAAPDDTAQ